MSLSDSLCSQLLLKQMLGILVMIPYKTNTLALSCVFLTLGDSLVLINFGPHVIKNLFTKCDALLNAERC